MGSGRRRGGLVAAAVAAVALASGCGGDDESASPLDRALGYLPADASLAIAVSTDFESEPYDSPEGQNVTLSVIDFAIEAATDELRLRLQAGL